MKSTWFLSVSPKPGQETSGISSPGNSGQRVQRRSRETESSPGGSRWHRGFGVDLCAHLSTHSASALLVHPITFFYMKKWRILGEKENKCFQSSSPQSIRWGGTVTETELSRRAA